MSKGTLQFSLYSFMRSIENLFTSSQNIQVTSYSIQNHVCYPSCLCYSSYLALNDIIL